MESADARAGRAREERSGARDVGMGDRRVGWPSTAVRSRPEAAFASTAAGRDSTPRSGFANRRSRAADASNESCYRPPLNPKSPSDTNTRASDSGISRDCPAAK